VHQTENTILSEQLKGGSGLTGDLIAYKLETCTGEAQVTRRKGNKVLTPSMSPHSTPNGHNSPSKI